AGPAPPVRAYSGGDGGLATGAGGDGPDSEAGAEQRRRLQSSRLRPADRGTPDAHQADHRRGHRDQRPGARPGGFSPLARGRGGLSLLALRRRRHRILAYARRLFGRTDAAWSRLRLMAYDSLRISSILSITTGL